MNTEGTPRGHLTYLRLPAFSLHRPLDNSLPPLHSLAVAKYDSLKAFVEATGIVQMTLAHDLGISQGHLSKLISRKEQPSLTLAYRIHRRYNVAMEGLVKRPRTVKAA